MEDIKDIELKAGDILHNRYSVLTEISGGGYSTVWLAQEKCGSRNVVLKIGAAGETLRESDIYVNIIDTGDAAASGMDGTTQMLEVHKFPGSNRAVNTLVKCLDDFKHVVTPDEIYHCLVFEPMAMSLGHLIQMFHPPLRVVKRALKDVLHGLDYLHTKGYLHGDLHGDNVLVASCDLANLPVDLITMGKKLDDGKDAGWGIEPGLWDTKLNCLNEHTVLRTKLSDLGSAYPLDDPPAHALGPSYFRSPEDILATDGRPSLDQKIDIWCFGLLAHLALTDENLFEVSMEKHPRETSEEWDDRHLLQMVDMAGEFPQKMLNKWCRRQHYYLQSMEVGFWSRIGALTETKNEMTPHSIFASKPVEWARGRRIDDSVKAAAQGKVAVIANASLRERDAIVDMLSRCLALDKSLRPEARELLAHPFFDDV